MKFQYFLFIGSALAADVLTDVFARRPQRIYNGEEVASIEQVPYLLSLQRGGKHRCGAIIISENWALTAAHCFNRGPIEHIHAGSTHKQEPGSVHQIDSYIVHPNFRKVERGDSVGDIALIKVANPFVIDNTRRPVELFNEGEVAPIRAVAVVSGWGSMESFYYYNTYPDIMRLTRVYINTKTECESDFHIEPEGRICAVIDTSFAGPCSGDSGGPLTVNGRLVGIVSSRLECDLMPGVPGVYTDVAFYRKWIRDNSGV